MCDEVVSTVIVNARPLWNLCQGLYQQARKWVRDLADRAVSFGYKMLRNGHREEPGVEILVRKPVIDLDPSLDPASDPGSLTWIQTFSNRLAQLDTHRIRLHQMDRVYRDLSRMTTALARSPAELPATQLEALQQRLEQARQIADSPASCSAFEVNIFWLLLEQEIRAIAERLQQLHRPAVAVWASAVAEAL
jgi:hypothetical protein